MSYSTRNLEIEVVGSETINLQSALVSDCTQSGDRFGPHYRTWSSEDSLSSLRTLFRIPPEVEFVFPRSDESPEMIHLGYFCAYELYFKDCGLFYHIPDVRLLHLHYVGIALPHMILNMLRSILCTLMAVAEAGF